MVGALGLSWCSCRLGDRRGLVLILAWLNHCTLQWPFATNEGCGCFKSTGPEQTKGDDVMLYLFGLHLTIFMESIQTDTAGKLLMASVSLVVGERIATLCYGIRAFTLAKTLGHVCTMIILILPNFTNRGNFNQKKKIDIGDTTKQLLHIKKLIKGFHPSWKVHDQFSINLSSVAMQLPSMCTCEVTSKEIVSHDQAGQRTIKLRARTYHRVLSSPVIPSIDGSASLIP